MAPLSPAAQGQPQQLQAPVYSPPEYTYFPGIPSLGIQPTSTQPAIDAYNQQYQQQLADYQNQVGLQESNQQAQESRLGFVPSMDTLTAGGMSALARLGASRDYQRDVAGQAFDEAGNLLAPIASDAYSYQEEQANLLGLNGPEARAAAMARVSDPLAAAQDTALLRNRAALGGVGPSGNVLAALAENARQRTEANIGNRINQLSAAGSPALNALQQLSQQALGRGEVLTGIESSSAANEANLLANLAQQLSTAQQQGGIATANTILGQGTQLAQLAQNLGNVQAGAPLFRAQNASPLSQALQTGLNTYTGLGGAFNMPPPRPEIADTRNPNTYYNVG